MLVAGGVTLAAVTGAALWLRESRQRPGVPATMAVLPFKPLLEPASSEIATLLFAVQAAYDQWVPAFEALFEAEGRDFPRFYKAARALSRLPATEREARLKGLMPTGPGT
jgi:hypothetical protein